jgi:hypothetical protein
MAKSKYFVDINLQKNELLNLVVQKTTINSVQTPIAGQIIYDTSDNLFKYYDGAVWQASINRLEGALQFKGLISDYSQPAVSGAQAGDLYILGTDGVISNYNGDTVKVGDFIIYSGSGWDTISGNIIFSSEDERGIVEEIATNEETITGTDQKRVITPASLSAWALQTNKNVIRQRVYVNHTISVSGTTFTHDIGNDNPIVAVYDQTGREAVVAVHVGNGTVTVTVNENNLENATIIIAA